jgi:hypothetical protein
MPKGPPLRFDVPPTKWFVDRRLDHVEGFDLHFSLKNGQGNMTITSMVLDKQIRLEMEVLGKVHHLTQGIENNLADAFCVLICTVLHRMNKDAAFYNRPCRLAVGNMRPTSRRKKP